MRLIYESERGKVTRSWWGGFRIHPQAAPVARKLPPWMKSRVITIYYELKRAGYEP